MEISLNTSYHKTTSSGASNEAKAYNLNSVTKWLNHNHRNFNNDVETSKYCYSKIDTENSFLNDYDEPKQSYKEWFNNQIPKDVIDEYNAKQSRKDRQIRDYDYFTFLTKKPKLKQAIAEQIVVQFGSSDEFKNLPQLLGNEKWKDYWVSYKNDLKKQLSKTIPEFKIYDISLHLDETSPHFHIVGVGFKQVSNFQKGLRVRVNSGDVFDLQNLYRHHKELREFNQKQASKLNELLAQNNIVYNPKNGFEIKKEKKLFYNYENITFKANQTNLCDLENVESKKVANIIADLETNSITKKDMNVLRVKLDAKSTKNLEQTLQELKEYKVNNLDKVATNKNKELNNAIQKYEELIKDTEWDIQVEVNKRVENIINEKVNAETSKYASQIDALKKDLSTFENYINKLAQNNQDLNNQLIDKEQKIKELATKAQSIVDSKNLTIENANKFMIDITQNLSQEEQISILQEYEKQTNQKGKVVSKLKLEKTHTFKL